MIGIYKITNKINRKGYFGKSIDILDRWRQEKKVMCLETKEIFGCIKGARKKYNISYIYLLKCCKNNIMCKKKHWELL